MLERLKAGVYKGKIVHVFNDFDTVIWELEGQDRYVFDYPRDKSLYKNAGVHIGEMLEFELSEFGEKYKYCAVTRIKKLPRTEKNC